MSALASGTCAKSGSSATTPSLTAPVDPSIPIPNLAGSWTGTMESSAFATRTISMQLTQRGVDCVDGDWQTQPAEWTGAVSGFALPGSFTGFLSLEGAPNGSGLCSGTNRTTGSTGETAIKWTVTYNGACAGGIPQTVTFRLRRKTP